jgi:hypothetical protein
MAAARVDGGGDGPMSEVRDDRRFASRVYAAARTRNELGGAGGNTGFRCARDAG